MKAPAKILVAVDFSETSDRALEAAIVYAKQFGASLDLVHAFTLPVAFVSPYEVAIPEGFFDDARKGAVKTLNENLAKAEAAGVQATATLIEEQATKALTDFVERQQIDLLIMGTRGHTGLKHVLLGSVAERTLHRANCSVLVVK
ncbi:MAG: universal stress protein [Deltaproteobacteria bacterium]|nr:universal stress protein [Deltaproteobacteria bacterium]